MTKEPIRVLGRPRSHSVDHDGQLYEFRSKPFTVGNYEEWVRQVDERDSQCRNAIVDIDGNPTAQYPDEVVDACVGKLKRHHEDEFSRVSSTLKSIGVQGVKLSPGISPRLLAGISPSKPLAAISHGLREMIDGHKSLPLVAPRSPKDRIVGATHGPENSLRDEEKAVPRARLRWIGDKIGLPLFVTVLASPIVLGLGALFSGLFD